MEKLKEILTELGRKGDLAARNADELVRLAVRYVGAVVVMEHRLPILRLRLEAEAYREAVKEMDVRRRGAHDALIAQAKVVNRLCERTGLPLVLVDASREAVANLAFRLVAEFAPQGCEDLAERARKAIAM